MARERGLTWKGTPDSIEPHPMGEFRRVPMRRLIAKLGLSDFNNTGPMKEYAFAPRARDAAAQATLRVRRLRQRSQRAAAYAQAI